MFTKHSYDALSVAGHGSSSPWVQNDLIQGNCLERDVCERQNRTLLLEEVARVRAGADCPQKLTRLCLQGRKIDAGDLKEVPKVKFYVNKGIKYTMIMVDALDFIGPENANKVRLV